jgi:hypothetical protein
MMIHVKRYLMRKFGGVGLMILAGMLSPVFAQKAEQDVPLVINGKIPFYPIMARAARIQGIVKIRVVTDGEKVTSADVESGPPMLARFAKENVLTWEFSKHKPTTFVATFEYEIEGANQCTYSNGSSILNLPLEVRINAKGVQTCDPAAEIKSHR